MHDSSKRVEQAVSATSSGNMTPDQWQHDTATALGFAGRSNPLGFAVVRYLSDEPSAPTVWAVIMHLASALVRRGYDGSKANDAAWLAFEAWNNMRCPTCAGRGVLNIEQHICRACAGKGQRDQTKLPECVQDGISELMGAEQRMEGQLASRLREPALEVNVAGPVVTTGTGGRFVLHLPVSVSGALVGHGVDARTAARPSHD